ncbi:MAG: ABC transporter substrate-binding protein [Eubacteriales bacterium]|nr:ABC transporter substrate-binding protein [Eubacteriales bacterium]
MKKNLLVCACAMMTFALVACSNNATVKETSAVASESANVETTMEEVKSVYKFGGIGPTTGGAAVYGQAVKNGMEIAVNEVNAKGGINGSLVEMNFQDDEHDAEKSVNAYNSLKDWGMQVLVGTTTSAPCIAVAAESFNDNMFQITPSGSAVDCATNDNVFRVCFSDPDQGKASAQYISNNKLATNVGVIYDSSDVYSSGIRETFVQEAKSVGLNVVAEEKFTADSKTDFTTQLKKLQDANVELVFLPFYYNEAALVLKQADQMQFKPTFFSCDGMDGILTLENFDKALAEGVMLLTPFSADAKDSLTQNFVNEYKQKYGEVPNQFAADAYDAVYIVKKALEQSGAKASESHSVLCDALKNAMTQVTVDGLTGNQMKWAKNGEPNKEPKAVKIVNGEYQLQ